MEIVRGYFPMNRSQVKHGLDRYATILAVSVEVDAGDFLWSKVGDSDRLPLCPLFRLVGRRYPEESLLSEVDLALL